MKTSEVLNGAADAIERDGWWQDNGEEVSGAPLCASNAISKARKELPVAALVGAHKALWEYIGGSSLGDIFAWNDAPQRTKAEVLYTMRAAALLEAAKEAEATTQPAVGVGAGSAS